MGKSHLVWLVLPLVGGCDGLLGLKTPAVSSLDGGGDDAPIADAPAAFDGPDAAFVCVMDTFDFCKYTPAAPVMFNTSRTITTSVGSTDCGFNHVQTDGTSIACLIYATDIKVAAGVTLTVTGTRPLIIASTGMLTIDGTINAGSSGGNVGPDPNHGCSGNPGVGSTYASGGGGGGMFGASGASGGWGGGFQASPGTSNAAIVPTLMRGGCAGGSGGNTNNGTIGGGGGTSGGALWLIAQGDVAIPRTGTVVASGGGGAGGHGSAGAGGSGGGGGGSGGYIRITAGHAITVVGTIAANGGGGGGGGTTTTATGAVGSPGAASTVGGAGGDGAGNGGLGGVGGSITPALPGYSAANASGGGGGGGGAGLIVLKSTTVETTGGTVSPGPT